MGRGLAGMCGMSRAGAGGAGRGGGSERDGKFVLRSRGGGWGLRGRRGRGAQGGGHRPGGAGPGRAGPPPVGARAAHPMASRPVAVPGLPAPRRFAPRLPVPRSQLLPARRALPHLPRTPPQFGARGWAGPRAELPPSRLDSRRGAASRGAPGGRSARASGLPTRTPPPPRVRSCRGGAPSPAREPAPNSRGPRPRPALATAPSMPGPGLSGSPREACFSNFSLSPSSRTSGALPLGPGPPRGASRHYEPAEFR